MAMNSALTSKLALTWAQLEEQSAGVRELSPAMLVYALTTQAPLRPQST